MKNYSLRSWRLCAKRFTARVIVLPIGGHTRLEHAFALAVT